MFNGEVMSHIKDNLYCFEQIECTKEQYENQIRSEIIDAIDRWRDVGDDTRREHGQKELKRLDRQFGLYNDITNYDS